MGMLEIKLPVVHQNTLATIAKIYIEDSIDIVVQSERDNYDPVSDQYCCLNCSIRINNDNANEILKAIEEDNKLNLIRMKLERMYKLESYKKGEKNGL